MSENNVQTLRVALYARVSSEEQKEGQTIDSQIAEMERFAKEKGWQLAGIYKDEGWSGSLLGRPELDHLRDDASKGLFGIVLINDVDRLARDVSHLGIIKRDLERHSVQVVFKKLPSEKSPTYNLMVNILGSFAEFERELITDRTRRGRRHKVEVRQQYLGSEGPYGYRYIPKDSAANKEGYLVMVVEEAAVVRQMFDWVDKEGLSARAVAKRLTAMSVQARRGDTKWAKSSVLRVLRNETYAGVWHYNKHESCTPTRSAKTNKYQRSLKSSMRLRARSEWLPVVLPDHLRIVEQHQWERVQSQLTNNTTFSPRNSKHGYLLKGLVRCGGCGASCVGDPSHGRFYYRCQARCKKNPLVTEQSLNSAVWSAVEEAVLNPSIITGQLAVVRERMGDKADGLETEASDIKRTLDAIQTEEERILEAYRTSILSPAQLGRELEKISTRKASLEGRKAALSVQQNKGQLPLIRQSIIDYCRIAADRLMSFTFEERQRFLRLLINEIVFRGDQATIRGVIPISRSEESNLETTRFDAGLPEINSTGRFAGIGAVHDARNPACGFSFELVGPIPQKPLPLRERIDIAVLRALLKERPGASLQELCDHVQNSQGIALSITSMSRILGRIGLSYKARHQEPGSGAQPLDLAA